MVFPERREGGPNPVIAQAKTIFEIQTGMLEYLRKVSHNRTLIKNSDPDVRNLLWTKYMGVVGENATASLLRRRAIDSPNEVLRRIIDKPLYQGASIDLLFGRVQEAAKTCNVLTGIEKTLLAIDIAEAMLSRGYPLSHPVIVDAIGIAEHGIANPPERAFLDVIDKKILPHTKLAFVMQQGGLKDKAEALMHTAEETLPQVIKRHEAQAYATLARGYLKLGDTQQAQLWLIKAMQKRKSTSNLGHLESVDIDLVSDISYAFLIIKEDQVTQDFLTSVETFIGKKSLLGESGRDRAVNIIGTWLVDTASDLVTMKNDASTKEDFFKFVFAHPKLLLGFIQSLVFAMPEVFPDYNKALVLSNLYAGNIDKAKHVVQAAIQKNEFSWQTGIDIIDASSRLLAEIWTELESRAAILEAAQQDAELADLVRLFR